MTIINAVFSCPNAEKSLDFRTNVELISPIIKFIQQTDRLGKDWLLLEDSEAESLLYPAFGASGELTEAAEAVLETEFKGKNIRHLVAWDGDPSTDTGANIQFFFNNVDWPFWKISFDYAGQSILRLGGFEKLIEFISICARTLRPRYITIAANSYFHKQVFKDRPGVGWMLYLPRVLTVQQVPEARALVPVLVRDQNGKDRQIGTIIASITDEPFSEENPEHVKVANAIEIRLADQDLIPLFSER